MANRETANNPSPLTLAVKIDKSLKMGKRIPVAVGEAWVISFEKSKRIDTIVAISKQRVVGVFSVGSPSLIRTGVNANRVKFNKVVPLPQGYWKEYISKEPFTFNSAVKYL